MREIKEETGVDIEILDELLTIDHMIPDEEQHWIATPFTAKIKDGQTPKIVEPHKHGAIGWFGLDSLPEPLALTTDLNLQSYERHLKNGGKYDHNH